MWYHNIKRASSGIIWPPRRLYVNPHVPASSSHMAHHVKNAFTRFSAAVLNFLTTQFFPDCQDSLNLTSTHHSPAKSNFIGGSEACKGPRKPKNLCEGPFFWCVSKSYLSHFVGPKNGQLNQCLLQDSTRYYWVSCKIRLKAMRTKLVW
jgi:hypothetical protein